MQTTYQGLTINYIDQLELDTVLEEVFKTHTYYIDLDTTAPRIIDAGAHIGLTTLYLHKQYPHAEFVCIEPHPQNIELLKKNLADNGIENVTIIPKALVGKDETRSTVLLFSNNRFTVLSSLHEGGWTGDDEGSFVDVDTIKLSEILTMPVDILKMDIEGQETAVIEEAAGKLSLVKNMIIEFHKTAAHSEEKILQILRDHFGSLKITKDLRREKDKRNQLLLIEAIKA
jgi:FkbM family methyltransferase